jgi:hypothetical protein
MPLNTVQHYLQGVLDQLVLPLGIGTLDAYITPPNPRDNVTDPAAYIWGSHGDESRLTVPRAQHGDLASGGDKTLAHRTDVWLTWFGEADNPQVDQQFPAIVDAVLAVLRNVEMLDQTQHAQDPVTGQLSNLLNVGENMTWEYGPVRATADQRYLRYDAQITVEVIEIIQA